MPRLKPRFILALCLSAIAFRGAANVTSAESAAPNKPLDLLREAKWEYSIDGGKTFAAAPAVGVESNGKIVARTDFDAPDAAAYIVLELTPGADFKPEAKFTLNGRAVKGPLDKMQYRTIPAIDPGMLVKGKNTLTATFNLKTTSKKPGQSKTPEAKSAAKTSSPGEKTTTATKKDAGKPAAAQPVKQYLAESVPKMSIALAGLGADRLKFESGPILGAFGDDYFSATCRTNMPAAVRLTATGSAQPSDGAAAKTLEPLVETSPVGLFHRFRVARPKEFREFRYELEATCGATKVRTGPFAVKLPDFEGTASARNVLRFAAIGDNRTNPKNWTAVAAAIVKAKPDFVLYTGDAVTNGLYEWQWNAECFGPAKELFATVPIYPVIGNHERNAPLWDKMFYAPSPYGQARNWSETIADVHLVGFDGAQDWSKAGKNAKWLDTTLGGVKSRFTFVCNHYPALSSGSHGALGKDNRIAEKPLRQACEVILPIMEKHRVTAFVVGHEHCYERSEPPGQVTLITSGGAGAPTHAKVATAAKQNPYSKVFAAALHYSLFEIQGDTCTLRVIDLKGKQLDTRTWKARADNELRQPEVPAARAG
ncbi:MAG: metallophosphoesterase family protein [Pirellulales bacterium]